MFATWRRKGSDTFEPARIGMPKPRLLHGQLPSGAARATRRGPRSADDLMEDTMADRSRRARLLILVSLIAGSLALASPTAARGDDIGQVKVARGAVHIERGGQRTAARVGAGVQRADVVVTGPDGSVGILFADASLLSAGPNSVLALDRFAFDSTTNQGVFESSLRKGTLAAVSGKIAKQSPGAMKVRTPAAVLGVRGTEFAVRASGPGD